MASGKSSKPVPVRPAVEDISALTDVYFSKSRAAVEKFGDMTVTYGVFMRRTVVCAPRLATDWLRAVAAARDTAFDIELCVAESHIAEADEAMLYITGSLYHLVDLETLYLQKLGAACVAAYNASEMCIALPKASFMAFDARHCAGADMAEMMAYAAAVGTERAQRRADAIGFVGNATDATAHFFGQEKGLGTMPHALIGYAGSTVRAAEMLNETFPGEPMTVLIDYYGQENSDAIVVCQRFPDLAAAGDLSLRIDTPSGRYAEGLDDAAGRALIERHAPGVLAGADGNTADYLVGQGTSAAAVWNLRESLDAAGFENVKIVASSGFGLAKCCAMAAVNAPIDTVGTGSFLPDNWPETYATADIVDYGGQARVKAGREFLLRR
ncbi:MAG: nicotinate phosphoribosyltransferase [Alphaproteobacteria bacterium]|nr:nicotinate phosphoribosyltransferase [Alphaproteobacteria bacterium]